MYIHNNRGGLFIPLQLVTKGIRQAHRLQADAKVSAWYAPLLQKGVRDFVDGRSRHCNRPEARKARRRQADGPTVRVYDSATYGGGLQPNIEPDVRND